MAKVRSILNKLTPEKFQKLSDNLLSLELSSEIRLQGLILLIFEKALTEHIYSGLYARLCKRLNEEAPNFAPPGGPTTFRLLLLIKCRMEFENGPDADEAFQPPNGTLTPEDEEWRYTTKRRTLGNTKFIGELIKMEFMSEGVAHHCIRRLLPRQNLNRRELECLVQLIKTCGRKLDSEKGYAVMNKYFSCIKILSECRQLSPRFRFMMLNLIDLRNDGWIPRKAVNSEGPSPITDSHASMDNGGNVKLILRNNQDNRRKRGRQGFRGQQYKNANNVGLQPESEDNLGNLHNILPNLSLRHQAGATNRDSPGQAK